MFQVYAAMFALGITVDDIDTLDKAVKADEQRMLGSVAWSLVIHNEAQVESVQKKSRSTSRLQAGG